MADLTPQSDPDGAESDDVATAQGTEPTTGAPRWVKAFGAVAVVLIVLVVVLLLAGGGNHGPGRHSGSPDAALIAPASDVAASGVGGHAPRALSHAPG